ncbi:MAG: hypothetical protein ACYDDA_12415 [Acidiferrobacteraceae bacterium]
MRLRRLSVVFLAVVSMTASAPAFALGGSATAAINLWGLAIENTIIAVASAAKAESVVGLNLLVQNIDAVGGNITSAIQGQTLAQGHMMNAQTSAVAAAMRQSRAGAGIMRLEQARLNLAPPSTSCEQTVAAQQMQAGSTLATAARQSASAQFSDWNSGAIPNPQIAKIAHVKSLNTPVAVAAYNRVLSQETRGQAFDSGALFHPSTPPPSTTSSQSSTPALNALTEAEAFNDEVISPNPLPPAPSGISEGGRATWTNARRAETARLSLAQATMSGILKDRTPNVVLGDWASTMSQQPGASGVFLQQRISAWKLRHPAQPLAISKAMLLHWMTQSRFENPAWYQAVSGETSGALIRTLVFMQAQQLAMQDQENRLLQHIASLDSVRESIAVHAARRRSIQLLHPKDTQ